MFIRAVQEKDKQKFTAKVAKDKIFSTTKRKPIAKDVIQNYQHIDLESIEQLESKDIGGEWLVKQAFDHLDIPSFLSPIGLDAKQIVDAQLLLTAKLLHPSNELEAMRWLNTNSAASQLYEDYGDITRYRLYQAATSMYKEKKQLDELVYQKIGNLFPSRNKIVVYDLTNIYFEGQMQASNKAKFGRSKQKRNDHRLIRLALSIDSFGFVRNRQFFNVNISEPGTFLDLLDALLGQLTGGLIKPLIVMDAGIATEENLALLRGKSYKYNYVSVSRSKPKTYDKISENAKTITDNRGHEIQLTKVSVAGKENHFLYIKSAQKLKKKAAMDEKMIKN